MTSLARNYDGKGAVLLATLDRSDKQFKHKPMAILKRITFSGTFCYRDFFRFKQELHFRASNLKVWSK